MRAAEDCQKVYTIGNVLGMAGSGARAAVLLAWDVFEEAVEASLEAEGSGLRVSLTEYCAALRRAFDEAGVRPNDEGYYPVSLIFTDGRSLQLVNSGLLVEGERSFVATGSGYVEAYAGREGARRAGASLRRQAEIAVETAAALDAWCGGATQWHDILPGPYTLVR